MSDLRLPTTASDHTVRRVPPGRPASVTVTPIARVMPPLEVQAHVQAYVRAGGLPRPEAFHTDPHRTLFLVFADGDTAAVDRWAVELDCDQPGMSEWGAYVAITAPHGWYGWSVILRCEVLPVAHRVHYVEYGGKIEVHAPSPDPTNPAAGPMLGRAMYRAGHNDYLVVLRGADGPYAVPDHDAAWQMLVTGVVPAEAVRA